MEHRRRRARPSAAIADAADRPAARPLRARRLLHYGQGKWYPGEAAAALGARALLARATASRSGAASARAEARRDRRRRPTTRLALSRAARRGGSASIRHYALPAREDPLHWIKAEATCRPTSTWTTPRSTTRRARASLRRALEGGLSQADRLCPAAAQALAKAEGERLAERGLDVPARPALSGPRRLADRLSPAAGRAAVREAGGLSLHRPARPVSRRAARCPPSTSLFAPAATPTARAGQIASGAGRTPPSASAPPSASSRGTACFTSSCRRWPRLEDYLELLARVEATPPRGTSRCASRAIRRRDDPRLNVIKVTPDPGVIEVNIQPAAELARGGGHHHHAL